MNFYALSALINGIISTGLGVFIFTRNRRDVRYITHALFCVSVAIWSYFYFAWQLTSNPDAALLYCRVFMAAAAFIPISYLHHLSVFFNLYNKNRKLIFCGYLGGLLFLLLDFTPFFIKNVSPKLIFKFWPNPGIAFHIFLIMWVSYMVYGVLIIVDHYKKSRGFEKSQLRYVMFATFIGWGGGATNYFLWYDIPILPFGNILVSGYMMVLTYAIFKYRLMDIRVALSRAGIFTFVYAFVLGIPFLIVRLAKPYLVGAFSDRWWLVIMAVGMVLAGVGPLIYMKLQRRAEAVLLRQERERHEALAKASRDILRFNRLDSLTRAIVHSLVRIMQVKLAAIYLLDEEKNAFILKSCWQPPLKNPDLPQEFAFDSLLVKELNKEKNRTLNLDEVRFRSQNRSALETFELKQVFERLTCQLIIPAVRADKLMGFLALGEKRSERGYSQEDIEVLMVLANHATLAIENAVFNEDERERQAIMFHSASLASLGTMASMMGHQVNNRFQAVNNLAGSAETLEILLASSSGFSEDDWKRLAQQAITSLRRISEEATKGGEIVASIRRLGKLSSEEFKPLTVKEVLDIALGILKYKIKFEEFEFITQVPETLPKIMGDATQLGEVFFNLIDNAYDAIRERKQSGNDPGYKPQIHINAHIKNDARYVFIEVKDTGIGVKEEFKSKLFIPFYTTKASSGKGTGLGLHVIKRIIEFHHGKISVESKYGEGTTFKIELPAAGE